MQENERVELAEIASANDFELETLKSLTTTVHEREHNSFYVECSMQ